MKKIILLVAILGLLIGCAHNINQVRDKWGPPAKIEQGEHFTVYYYYFQKGKSIGYYPGDKGGIATSIYTAGWLCVELTCDKYGKIIKKRQYWAQPKI